jgi:AraC family carnitine catabolism transcriptional activator
MEESVEPLVSPRDLARRLCVTQRQMERLFSHHLGTTPSRYQKRVRLNRAQRMLRHTTLTVTEIAVACGFQSPSHFSKVYRQAFGSSPRRDRILA